MVRSLADRSSADCITSTGWKGLPLERQIVEKASPFDPFSSGKADHRDPRASPVSSGACRTRRYAVNTPRAVLLVDTREQNPFHFSRCGEWFAGIEKKSAQAGRLFPWRVGRRLRGGAKRSFGFGPFLYR